MDYQWDHWLLVRISVGLGVVKKEITEPGGQQKLRCHHCPGVESEAVTEFVYLGSVESSDARCSNDISQRIV